MANDLWQEVEEAYAHAAGLPQDKRASFLVENYAHRPDIRNEVESLLAQKRAAEEMSRSTLFAAAAEVFGDTGGKDDEIIGSIIAGKYLVRERIGAGKMGEVYLADHLAFDMPFALKRPAPALRNDASFRRRLLEEARRAVMLKHENIARVYDIVESGEDMFVVMEYIDGETLRTRLEREGGRLPISEFLPIAIQCTSALAAAHEKRIVHLDVKPENIMIASDGQVKMCDFGVARKLSPGNASDTTTASEGRWIFGGTPAYMAPEVILSYQFDERADQFSLGIIFYELLTGKNPFIGDTVVATTARIVKDSPPPVRDSNPDVDPRLERVVMRLLAKDPEERYATTMDLVKELENLRRPAARVREFVQGIRDVYGRTRWMKPAVALFLLCVIVLPAVFIYTGHLERWLGVSTLPQKKIVVVLPFRVIGGTKGDRFYSDGISEILAGRLTRLTESIRDLQVIPPGEIIARNVENPARAQAEFGATLVLAGTFQVSGDLVRVSYSLIDAARNRELRAGSKQLAAADPFTIQDAVIRDVTQMLELELKPPLRQAAPVFGTKNPEAYFLYTEGRGALRNFQQIENIDQAINLFTLATEMDPDYAAAFAALGQSYWRKFSVMKDAAWLTLAKTVCEKSANQDQKLSQARTCLGLVYQSKGDYERAVEDFRNAIALDKTNDDAQLGLGTTLEAWGHLDDAEQAYQQAISSRQQYWAGYMWLAAFYKNRRHNYSRAIENYSKALDASPGNVQVYYALGGAYIDDGKYDEAISMLQKAVELKPVWQTYSNLGMAYLRARKYNFAVPALEKASGMAGDYRASGNLARIYWLTGQKERARNEYKVAIDQGEKLLQVNSRDFDVHLLVGRYYAMLGNKVEATNHLTPALNTNPADPHYLIIAAVSYLQLGDTALAINYLEQAVAHETRLIDIQAEPELDALESDPGFIALISAQRRRN
jgi:tetratricopeptide (TPR) repeat protein/TolB-like protein/predicted Ser/Thr protein kinase